jgi:hypothetical protein
VPSRRCRPECPKYGKKAYFGYSGRHQVHMNFQPSPPLSLPVATPGKDSAAAAVKIIKIATRTSVSTKRTNWVDFFSLLHRQPQLT